MTDASPNNPTLAEALRNLDVSQFSTVSRMKPTTANLPPNASQKEYLRKHAAESHILLRIAGLWMSNQVNRLIFGNTAVPTIQTYMNQDGSYVALGKLDLFELSQLRALHKKAGLDLDLKNLDPRLFGMPVSIREGLATGCLEVELHSKQIISLQMQTVEDADSVFKKGNVPECFLFAFFYLLDQRVLLDGQRERGQIIPRFLRIYASHTMNQILFTYFDAFMMAYRECMLQGIPEDQITLAMLAAVMTRGAE